MGMIQIDEEKLRKWAEWLDYSGYTEDTMSIEASADAVRDEILAVLEEG